MDSIISLNNESKYLEVLNKWFNIEWQDFGKFEKIRNGIEIPNPILAISDYALQGGLSFTIYKNPDNDSNALWINALYVEPDSRGYGIGSMLINAAANEARSNGFTEIYVYTDKPSLYTKNGWNLNHAEESNSVLELKLIESFL